MNKLKFYILIFLAAILSSSYVFAEVVDGKSFLKAIEGSDHDNINSIAGFYEGYISGVADSTLNVKWCPPYELKRKKLLLTITDYYSTKPIKAGEASASAKDLILDALMDIYPCEK